MKTFLFAVGVLVGMALKEINHRSIQKAVENERERSEHIRRENHRLKEDLSAMMQANDCRIARKRGYEAGRKSPLSQAEQLVGAFGGREVDIRGRRPA